MVAGQGGVRGTHRHRHQNYQRVLNQEAIGEELGECVRSGTILEWQWTQFIEAIFTNQVVPQKRGSQCPNRFRLASGTSVGKTA